MQLAADFNGYDAAYMAERGGWELVLHMRSGRDRAKFRQSALRRAMDGFRGELLANGPTNLSLGMGLLVIQRAILACEDLGGLWHALLPDDKSGAMKRLVSTAIPDLDKVFELIIAEESTAPESDECSYLEPFCLPADQMLVDEGWTASEIDAMRRLSECEAIRWRKQFCLVASLWARHRQLAKGTMHGYPVVAGPIILGPPPAGLISEGITDPGVPFVVSFDTEADHTAKQMRTRYTVVDLSFLEVDRTYRIGLLATVLYDDATFLQTQTIRGRCGALVTDRFLKRLTQADRELLKARMAGGPS